MVEENQFCFMVEEFDNTQRWFLMNVGDIGRRFVEHLVYKMSNTRNYEVLEIDLDLNFDKLYKNAHLHILHKGEYSSYDSKKEIVDFVNSGYKYLTTKDKTKVVVINEDNSLTDISCQVSDEIIDTFRQLVNYISQGITVIRITHYEY